MIETTIPVGVVEAARQHRAHERALALDKRRARREKDIHKAAIEYMGGKLTRGHSCRICHRHLTDEPSIQRSIGPECWDHILNAVERLKSRAPTRMQFAARWFVAQEERLKKEAETEARYALTREQWIDRARRFARVQAVEPSKKLSNYADAATIAAAVQALKNIYRDQGKAMAAADEDTKRSLRWHRREIKECLDAVEEGYVPIRSPPPDVQKILEPFTAAYNAAWAAAHAEAERKTEEARAGRDFDAEWLEYAKGQPARERAVLRHAQMLQTIVEIEDPVACVDILIGDHPDVSGTTLLSAVDSVENSLKGDGLGGLIDLRLELRRRHDGYRTAEEEVLRQRAALRSVI